MALLRAHLARFGYLLQTVKHFTQRDRIVSDTSPSILVALSQMVLITYMPML